jgi:dipeptidyl aminopeptidase/acylaminoacyl peptidase
VLYALPGGTVREVAFTPDGRGLVLTANETNAPTKRDILLVALDGTGAKPLPLVATAADEHQLAISPDGRWLAYMSDESGKDEVYVRAMKGATGSAVISKGGGASPRWTRDGRVVFLDAAGAFVRVQLTTVAGLPAAGKRDSLFNAHVLRADLHQNFDIAADGRFVVVRNATAEADVVVITNWWSRALARLRGP